jgi:DUF1680 family protein
MLLAYYEFTGNEAVLQAVVDAMQITMSEYNEGKRSPFDVDIEYGGVTHGLMMTDICETLFRLTNEKKYLDYAVYLYKEFSRYPINRAFNDVGYNYLMEDSLFKAHSAHTYEHLRTLLLAYKVTGYPELEHAYTRALDKLSKTILPSGAGFGDEWLAGKPADVDSTAAEFCGMVELQHFYLSALQKTGEIAFADGIEKIMFNAMLGARATDGKSITYCKTDNCFRLDMTSPHSGYKEEDFRYKYSPTHADAAVCCNPNYGRSFPYYVSNMWMRADDGLAAVLYGPATLNTTIDGVEIEITAVTTYPYSDKIEFRINPQSDISFNIYLRQPEWSENLQIISEGAEISQNGGYYTVSKTWSKGDEIQLKLTNNIHAIATSNSQSVLQRGALVYAFAIPFEKEIIKDWGVEGFTDYFALPTESSYQNLKLIEANGDTSFGFEYVENTSATRHTPWLDNNGYLQGLMYDSGIENNVEVKLIPMGSTVLRKVAFRKK